MESFSAPPGTPDPSGEDSAGLADDQESPVTTPVPSPGNSSATPASRGSSSFASRRRRSSYAPSSSPGGNSGIGGGVTGRVAPEPRCSRLTSSAAEPNASTGLDPQGCARGTAEASRSGGGHEGGGSSGEGVGQGSASRRRSPPSPPNTDAGSPRSPTNIGGTPVGFARCGMLSPSRTRVSNIPVLGITNTTLAHILDSIREAVGQCSNTITGTKPTRFLVRSEGKQRFAIFKAHQRADGQSVV